jgi:hypothetical protein
VNSEEFVGLGDNVAREEKIAFGSWAMQVLSKTKHWRRAYRPVQANAIKEIYGRLLNESDEAILEVIDLAFADLLATLHRESELDGAMDLVSLDPTLLRMDSELVEQLTSASLHQAQHLMMLAAAGKAAKARGLLKEPKTPAT